MPRVRLENLNTLQPFISTSDPEWVSNSAQAKHKGLVVYNLNTASPFAEGLYVWSGATWEETSWDVQNGLTEYVSSGNAAIELGGNLIKTTDINLNGNNFSITTGAEKKMVINGELQADHLYLANISGCSFKAVSVSKKITPDFSNSSLVE